MLGHHLVEPKKAVETLTIVGVVLGLHDLAIIVRVLYAVCGRAQHIDFAVFWHAELDRRDRAQIEVVAEEELRVARPHGVCLPGVRGVVLLQLHLHLKVELVALGLGITVLRVVGCAELRERVGHHGG